MDEWCWVQMNLHALRVFVEVAKNRSVTKAAEALSLTQPAVTAQIRNLEKEVGLQLLSARGRGIELTAEGELLYAKARRIFDWEKELESFLQEVRSGQAEKLRLFATNLPANRLLPKWLAAFKKRFPAVEVNLQTGNSKQAFDQLHRYQADISIVAGGWEEKGITREILFHDEMWFIVPSDHPLAGQKVPLDVLMNEPFLFREKGSSTRELLIALCRAHNVPIPKVGLQFNGMNEAIQSVLAGYGTMLVPEMIVKEYVLSGQAARVFVEGVQLKRPISICKREGEELALLAQSFVGMIHQLVNTDKS